MSDLYFQPVFLLGFGGVGRALARQILAARARHAQRNRLRLVLVGVADSASSVMAPSGLSDAAILDLLERKGRGERLADDPQPPALDSLPAHTIVLIRRRLSPPCPG